MKVFDLHCDTLFELNQASKNGSKINFATNNLHIDMEKLIQGDYLLQCFAVYVNLAKTEHPLIHALEEIDVFYDILHHFSENLGQVKEYHHIFENHKAGKISAILTMEEGGCCMGNLAILRMFYELGIRMMTLTWNYENELGYPNTISKEKEMIQHNILNTNQGLKEKGIEFLEEMENLKMIVDVSHLSDAGFWDVVRYTKKPFIASHSNARVISPHARNLNDDMIKTIGNRGGLIGINYYAPFLNNQIIASNCKSSISLIVEHISHIKKIGGIDVIGLGSDFDGIVCDLEIKDASFMPLLEHELRRKGFLEDEIEKIYYKNALRVFKELLG